MNDRSERNADTRLELAWACALGAHERSGLFMHQCADLLYEAKTADKMLVYEILVF